MLPDPSRSIGRRPRVASCCGLPRIHLLRTARRRVGVPTDGRPARLTALARKRRIVRRDQACQRSVVDKRCRIDVVRGGPREFLLTRKAAAVSLTGSGVVTAAGTIHTREGDAAILGTCRRKRYADRRNQECEAGRRDQSAVQGANQSAFSLGRTTTHGGRIRAGKRGRVSASLSVTKIVAAPIGTVNQRAKPAAARLVCAVRGAIGGPPHRGARQTAFCPPLKNLLSPSIGQHNVGIRVNHLLLVRALQ